jgi:diadenosine tetraphosphate (Ap4A) HIT family hydrolase
MPLCPACTRITEARAGSNPFFIAELRESIAVLHDHQSYEGWTVLLLKDHAEHLHQLDTARQLRLAEDITDAARALVAAFSPNRINYECLGNQLAHVHWHIIPRYLPPVDPDPRQPVWGRNPAELNCGVAPERRSDLIKRLRGAGMR